MRLNHIALEILHDKLKQLNSFLSKSKLKVLINLSNVLHVVIHTIWVVVVVEKAFQVISQKTKHYCVYQHHYQVIPLALPRTQSLVY